MSFLKDSSWAFVSIWTNQGLILISSFVLAAFIGPEGFGLYAMAAVVITFMAMLVDQGLIVALIQHPDLEDDHVHAIWWVVVALGAAFAAGAAALAGPWAGTYGEPELEILVLALAPVLVLKGLQVVPSALLRRNARFRDYAITNALAMSSAGALAIAAVIAGAGVWALVVQQWMTDIALTVLLWRASGHRPAFRFSWPHFKELLPVSSGAFAGSLGQFARQRADVLVIGFLLGPVAVGLFRLAVRLQELLLTLTMRPVATVTLTHTARHKGDSEAIRTTLGDALRLATSAAVPSLGLLAGCAGAILAVIGPDWAPARPALMVLALAGMVSSAMFFVPPVLNASGRSWLAARWTAAVALSAAAGFAIGAWAAQDADPANQGLVLALVVLAANLLVALPMGAHLVGRVAPVGTGDFVRPLIRALPLGIAGFAVPFGLDMAGLAAGWPPLIRLALLGSLGGLAVLAVLWAGYPDLVRDYLKPLLRKVRAKIGR